MRFFILITFLLTLISCNQEDFANQQLATNSSKYIFDDGKDRNETPEEDELEYPYNLIGKLIIANQYNCTATLVGKDLILTAAHCVVINGKINKKVTYTFKLGLNGNKHIDSSNILIDESSFGQSEGYSINTHKDWAILKLEKPLGEKYGYLDLKLPGDFNSYFDYSLQFAGYSEMSDKKNVITTQDKCFIRDILQVTKENKLLLHDCDSKSGDSGAAVLECNEHKCYVVALHIGSRKPVPTDELIQIRYTGNETLDIYTNKLSNIAISTKDFFMKVQQMKLQFELKD